MRGGGHEGRGEDICYAPDDHDLFPEPGSLGLGGSHTIASALGSSSTAASCSRASRACRPRATTAAGRSRAPRSTSRCARRARRSARSSGREPAPLRFVVSTRLDVRDWLAVAPGLEFKVDPIPGEWDEAHMDALAATGRVRVCDLKAHYVGTPVDVVAGRRLPPR